MEYYNNKQFVDAIIHNITFSIKKQYIMLMHTYIIANKKKELRLYLTSVSVCIVYGSVDFFPPPETPLFELPWLQWDFLFTVGCGFAPIPLLHTVSRSSYVFNWKNRAKYSSYHGEDCVEMMAQRRSTLGHYLFTVFSACGMYSVYMYSTLLGDVQAVFSARPKFITTTILSPSLT